MSSECPICKADIERPTEDVASDGSEYRYSCQRCGEFRVNDLLSYDLAGILQDDTQKRAVLSHWIRTEHESIKKRSRKDPIILTEKLVEDIIKNTRPSLPEQADSYIRWIGDNVKIGGQYIVVQELTIQAIIGSAATEEFELVSSHLRDAKLTEHKSETGVWRKVTLSFAGWERYRELKRATAESRKAFMAMEYGHLELDNLFKDVLKPAVKQTGFDLFVLPERPKAGLIDDRLRVEIRASRFLIVDLTHENRGAYWEAGYAEGLGRPVIYTCEEKKFEEVKTHFDTNHHLTIKWDAGDTHKLEHAAEELKATIRATLPAEAKLTDD